MIRQLATATRPAAASLTASQRALSMLPRAAAAVVGPSVASARSPYSSRYQLPAPRLGAVPVAHSSTAIVAGTSVAVASVGLKIAYEKYVAWRDDPHRATYAMRRHYRGAFADEMTKSEAARILGVRESADAETIQKKHRKLMILNHPDRGGSTFLAGKVNEAKQVLTGGSSATKAP